MRKLTHAESKEHSLDVDQDHVKPVRISNGANVKCLFMLISNLAIEEDSNLYNFYGKQSNISNNLGIEILQCLISLGVDIHDTNYYGQTVFDVIKEENSLTYRVNNDEFKKVLLNLLRCPSP